MADDSRHRLDQDDHFRDLYYTERMSQECPLCGNAVPDSPRYPRAVCRDCIGLAADQSGRGLEFFNASLSGGFVARYRDSGGDYPSHECWVRGRLCLADEAHMGGIVLQPMGDY